MKAYKSLDAYSYFVAGWVTGLQQWIVPGNGVHLVRAKVTHSQRLSEPPLLPWIAMQNDGQVIFGHCTCKAGLGARLHEDAVGPSPCKVGLGEVCSHVAATLFALESAVKHLKSRTCTDGPRQWGQSSDVTGGRTIFSSGCNIDFTSPERKRKQACMESCNSGPPPSKSKKTSSIPLMTQDEKENFLKRLSKSGTKSARLSLEAGFNDSFTPRTLQLNLPKPLSELYDPVHLGLSYPDLLLECEAAFQALNIDENQASSVEEETRKQAKSKLWFQMRAGRVTASRFKAAARTDPANPSKSLIKQICYPQAYKFTSAATEWGCQHENEARNVYKAHVAMQHRDFMVEDSGLIINPDYPHLGASPDGKIKCSCCGMGILEIKCPHCKRGASVVFSNSKSSTGMFRPEVRSRRACAADLRDSSSLFLDFMACRH
ncbi:uncharacterized protein LOC132882266 [Neoarius graeffei]|uniref:uncharacterized protein LOC132882266 n=1 Tax=Neoarius graeffei TaxID=443677 RepID=UPI00298C1A03|nr:uncharacterized protein LOC132882266 [Neoarius graeffei]